MSTKVVRPIVAQTTFNRIYAICDLPKDKVGFDTALNVVLKKMTLDNAYEGTIGKVGIVGNEKEDVIK